MSTTSATSSAIVVDRFIVRAVLASAVVMTRAFVRRIAIVVWSRWMLQSSVCVCVCVCLQSRVLSADARLNDAALQLWVLCRQLLFCTGNKSNYTSKRFVPFNNLLCCCALRATRRWYGVAGAGDGRADGAARRRQRVAHYDVAEQRGRE
jgi:hypothetical protein